EQKCTLEYISVLADLTTQEGNTRSPEFQADFLGLAQQLIQRLSSNYQTQLATSQEGIIWLLAATCYINKSATRIGSDE
ncbi:hypothetical protein NG798_27705, partial [Ancylothrix sp. C2]|uniref:hypothetical protein n=1 Tax=Ancylothrix sp. D3o TaxID=2953691 RepID=UPI0021BB486A